MSFFMLSLHIIKYIFVKIYKYYSFKSVLFNLFSVYNTLAKFFSLFFLYLIFWVCTEIFLYIENSDIQLIEECNSHYDTFSDNAIERECLKDFFLFNIIKEERIEFVKISFLLYEILQIS